MDNDGAETNIPILWRNDLPVKSGDRHKYDYGSASIHAAPILTGATALAATACARVGCGLVTVFAEPFQFAELRCALPLHVLLQTYAAPSRSKGVCLVGPGGIGEGFKHDVDGPTVLDAEAIRLLPRTAQEDTIITPHEGEFVRYFGTLSGSRLSRAKQLAAMRGCTVVLKGEKTIVASPNGRVSKNMNASPWLATAGTGDVLAGMIAGLLAQGMPPFSAASAAVWLHGEAGRKCGAYLVASDLLDALQPVLQAVARMR